MSKSRVRFPEYLRQPQRQTRTGASLRWVLLAGAGVLGYFLLLGESGFLTLHKQRAEVENLRQDLAELTEQQELLQHELEELAEPGSFRLERVAREQYGLVADGERVIHVVEPDVRPEDPDQP